MCAVEVVGGLCEETLKREIIYSMFCLCLFERKREREALCSAVDSLGIRLFVYALVRLFQKLV